LTEKLNRLNEKLETNLKHSKHYLYFTVLLRSSAAIENRNPATPRLEEWTTPCDDRCVNKAIARYPINVAF